MNFLQIKHEIPAIEPEILFKYGIYIGRAFQIRDDIIGMFSTESQTGKSNLSDLREAKKTLLVWYAYNHTQAKFKSAMRRVLCARAAAEPDLIKMRRIVTDSGSLAYAKSEISTCLRKAEDLIASSAMAKKYKRPLCAYSRKILGL